MTVHLKQSTAATVPMGPFLDSTDGVTPEESLTISQADIKLSKNGGAFAQSNNAAGASHAANGHYLVPLDTTDTNTLGRLRVAITESGATPVWQDFMVLSANVWDALYATDKLQVDLTQISGSTDNGTHLGTLAAGQANIITTNDNLAPVSAKLATNLGATYSGAAVSGSLSTTTMTSDLTTLENDTLNDERRIIWTSGNLAGTSRVITDYVKATGQFTFAAVNEAPQIGDTFIVV